MSEEYTWDDLSAGQQEAIIKLGEGHTHIGMKTWNWLFDRGLVDSTDGEADDLDQDYLTEAGQVLYDAYVVRKLDHAAAPTSAASTPTGDTYHIAYLHRYDTAKEIEADCPLGSTLKQCVDYMGELSTEWQWDGDNSVKVSKLNGTRVCVEHDGFAKQATLCPVFLGERQPAASTPTGGEAFHAEDFEDGELEDLAYQLGRYKVNADDRRELMARFVNMHTQSLQAQNAQQAVRIRELEDALKPFAEFISMFNEDHADYTIAFSRKGFKDLPDIKLTFNDLRNAANLLKPKS